jgi:hypothetical protein
VLEIATQRCEQFQQSCLHSVDQCTGWRYNGFRAGRAGTSADLEVMVDPGVQHLRVDGSEVSEELVRFLQRKIVVSSSF